MKENIWVEKDGYIVLRDGSIYKLNWRNTGKCVEIKQYKDKDGYLSFKCNSKRVSSHRFIASCFIPNPDNLPQINHKNEIKDDNRVENLEWCTCGYNNNYGTRNKRIAESNSKVQRNDPKKSRKVLQYTLDGQFLKEWVSVSEIQRQLGFDKGHISACCRGVEKSSYGFLWRYK